MASSVRLSDWVREVEELFGLKFSHEHTGKTADYTLVTFTNHLGEPHHAHVYDEKVTASNSDLRRRYSNLFTCYSILKILDEKEKQNQFHEGSVSLYHELQKAGESPKERKMTREEGSKLAEAKVTGSILFQNLVGLLYQTPRKGNILDLLHKFGRLTDDQAMLVCSKILEALDMLHRAKLVVTVIPLKCLFIDINEVYLDIMPYITSAGASKTESTAFTQQTIKTIATKDYVLLPPEVVLDKRITFETGVYCFGMLLYVLIELHELSLFFSEAKCLPLDYTKSSYAKLQKLIFQTTQIQALLRPKVSEMRQLGRAFLDVISSGKDSIQAKMFDYKNFPNSAKAKAAASESAASGQKQEKPVNHRAAVYSRIASARRVEKSSHDVSVREDAALEGGRTGGLTQDTVRCTTAWSCRRCVGTTCTDRTWSRWCATPSPKCRATSTTRSRKRRRFGSEGLTAEWWTRTC